MAHNHYGLATPVVILLTLCLLLDISRCADIIIAPFPGQECETETCITLSELAANPSSDENTTLIMLPGNYDLNVNISFSNKVDLKLYSDFSVTIECDQFSSLSFESIEHVLIRNMNFIGCGGNIVSHVDEFVIEDTTFKGKGTSGTSLTLINTTAEIRNCAFIRNQFGTEKQSVRTLIQLTTGINWFQVRDVTGNIRVGGALIISFSDVSISNCTFLSNRAEVGGDIFTEDASRISIFNSTFSEDGLLKGSDEPPFGGSIFAYEGDYLVEGSVFSYKQATVGGAITTSLSNFTVNNTNFLSNHATDHGAGILAYRANVLIQRCHFENNSAGAGAGVLIQETYIVVEASKFISNTVERHAAALEFFIANGNPIVRGCIFVNNVAHSFAGAVLMWFADGTLYGDTNTVGDTQKRAFNNSIDGVCYRNTSTVEAEMEAYDWSQVEAGDKMIFVGNSAPIGGALYVIKSTVKSYGPILFFKNNATLYSTVYILDSNGTFEGETTIYKSLGSFFAFNSIISFSGCNTFVKCSSPEDKATNIKEGGSLTVVQSSVHFSGESRFEQNHAEIGGVMVATESIVHFSNNVSVLNNSATNNGGAFSLSQSDIHAVRGSAVTISGNKANEKGGAIHAVSSAVKVTVSGSRTTNKSGDIVSEEYKGGIMNIVNNEARRGGAMYLEANSRITLLKDYIFEILNVTALNIIGNRAEDGGAIYVDDEFSSGACTSNPFNTESPLSECFVRVVATHTILTANPNYTLNNIHFDSNSANGMSANLFGGLLDRCTVTIFNEVDRTILLSDNRFQEYTGNGIQYLFDISSGISINTITSRPVQVCPCINNQPICSGYEFPTIYTKRGEEFKLSMTAVDQVDRPVVAALAAYLDSTKSDLIRGQVTVSYGKCTNVSFSVVSPHNSARLTIFADGPCQDAQLSRLSVNLIFDKCTCPIGFVPHITDLPTCLCSCDPYISQYVERCNSSSGTITRNTNVWISHVKYRNSSGYLVHKYCPFDYCNPPDIFEAINLNIEDGADTQCALNRTGTLCGACKPGLSLSLGSSRCLKCPSYWPALFVGITVFALLAGLGLVVLVLWLNLTVAVGTLNGLLFYANIVSANRIALLPYPKPNFITVFISWLNLELGIDQCYIEGMDIYAKTWLTLSFPIYVIFLVIVLIIISRNSSRFSKLIAKRDPVAALATLILISYGKLFHIILLAQPFSFAAVRYPDNSTRILWLPDGTVKYFSPKHGILAIVALVILVLCILYSLLFLIWQLILPISNWKIFKCLRNPSVHLFMAAHHVPFVAKHRYWIGLLLLARAVLYLIAAATVSGDPQVPLVSTIVVMSVIVLLKMAVATRIFKNNVVDALESFFYVNIIVFAACTSYNLSAGKNQDGVAYTSVTLSILMTIFIIVYHVYEYTPIFSRVGNTKIAKKIKKAFNNRLKKSPRAAVKPDGAVSDESIRRFDHILDLSDLSEVPSRPPSNNQSAESHPAPIAKPTYSVVEMPS